MPEITSKNELNICNKELSWINNSKAVLNKKFCVKYFGKTRIKIQAVDMQPKVKPSESRNLKEIVSVTKCLNYKARMQMIIAGGS